MVSFNRRDALKGLLGLAAAGVTSQAWSARVPVKPRYLVLVELKGGNDALNAFPPYRDPLYKKLRPNLALPEQSVIAVTHDLGLHKSFTPLLPSWDAGEIALVQGVGYPNPMLSHFESAQMWETGSKLQTVDTGWFAEPFKGLPSKLNPAAVAFGFNLGPLRGLQDVTIQINDLSTLDSAGVEGQALLSNNPSPALRHILQIQDQKRHIHHYTQALKILPPLPDSLHRLPFAQSLRSVAAMMTQPSAPLVYKLIQGGFDTHAGQLDAQGRQLNKLASSLAEFRSLMIRLGLWDQILVVTYSEFGRRVAENASLGTDHGAAQTQLLMGKSVKAGVHGLPYDLAHLDSEGNLPVSTDFREVFNSVCQSGLHLPVPFSDYKSLSLLS